MDFAEYISKWVNAEVLQARIMVGIGVLMLVAIVAIIRDNNGLLKGALLPLGLLTLVLIAYGGYILQSRPAHAEQSIKLYKQSSSEAYSAETTKHTNDNKWGNTLLRVYPILMLISVMALMFLSAPFYKGMAAGFVLLFLSIFVIDSGFVSRSNAFIAYLEPLK